jgi:hypothetical protein
MPYPHPFGTKVRGVDAGVRESIGLKLERIFRSQPIVTDAIDGSIPNDPEKPGPKAPLRWVVLAARPPGREKSVLDDVFRCGLVAQHL